MRWVPQTRSHHIASSRTSQFVATACSSLERSVGGAGGRVHFRSHVVLFFIAQECDDSSSCCSNCKLTAGSQCSGLSDCCNNQCKFMPPSTTCGEYITVPTTSGSTNSGRVGVCVNGQCKRSQCRVQDPTYMYACGTTVTYPCRESCGKDFACSNTFAASNDPAFWLPQATYCGTGRCADGVCSQYAWQYGAWGACSATRCNQAGSITRTATCIDGVGNTVSSNLCGSTPVTTQPCTGECVYSWQRYQLTNWSELISQ